jgi:hypothetical protein
MRFAPSLFAVLVSAWFWGRSGGLAAIFISTVGVNYFLLEPRAQWSVDGASLVASGLFLLLGVCVTLATSSVRRQLGLLRSNQSAASRALVEQSERLRKLEQEYDSRVAALRESLDQSLTQAGSFERVQRYARTIESRLGELQLALDEFPLPLALIAGQDGLPVMRASSLALSDLAGYATGERPAIWPGNELLVTREGKPFAPDAHPLVQAATGTTINGELVGWRSARGIQPVRLYAKPVVGNRLLAVVLIPQREVGGTDRMMN